MNCKWHQCNREFEPDHHKQIHCSSKCAKARLRWKAARGAALVDILVDNNVAGLVAQRKKLLDEIEKDTPK